MNAAKAPKTAKMQRNTSVEIVRILAMLMIILSHIYGSKSGENFSGLHKYIFVVVSSVFHSGLGVTLFMLISGYYMIKLTTQRLLKTASITWVCCWFGIITKLVFAKFTSTPSPDLKHIFMQLIPITSGYYWYISCYIFVMLLSPFFNMAINKLEKSSFRKLIGLMILLFYLIPTFFYFDIMGNKGKGLITMVSAYFIGAYMAKYSDDIKERLSSKTAVIILICTFAFSIAGNIAATIVRHGEASYPFSRECSITTLITGALIIILSTRKEFHIKSLNTLAANTLYLYIVGCATTGFISKLQILSKFSDSYLLYPIVIGLTLGVYLYCFVISLLLKYPASILSKTIGFVIEKIEPVSKKLLLKAGICNENTNCKSDNLHK